MSKRERCEQDDQQITIEQLAEFFEQRKCGRITRQNFQYFLNSPNGYQGSREIIIEWQNFYKSIGINCDLWGVQIPTNLSDFDRTIIMAQKISPQLAYELCQEHFKCQKWTNENLDKIVESERTTKNGPYAIRVRDIVEPEDGLMDLSHNDFKAKNIIGITLEERLIFGLKYFKETGKHLDIHNCTRCDGSRYSDGHVPLVYWRSGLNKLHVSRCAPDAYENLRYRSVVI